MIDDSVKTVAGAIAPYGYFLFLNVATMRFEVYGDSTCLVDGLTARGVVLWYENEFVEFEHGD